MKQPKSYAACLLIISTKTTRTLQYKNLEFRAGKEYNVLLHKEDVKETEKKNKGFLLRASEAQLQTF